MHRNTIYLIVFFVMVFAAIYVPYSYHMRKQIQKDIIFYASCTAKYHHYIQILAKVKQDHSGQVSSVSPDDLSAYFRNASLPPFAKLDKIMLPLDSVKIPSDEILFAIRINAKEAYAVTGAGEVKKISVEEMPKYQNP